MRKCALPTELANFTRDQISQLDDWLDRFTFPKVQDLFLETHGIPIGRGKLNRYNARRLKARAEAWRPWRAYAAAHLWHNYSGG